MRFTDSRHGSASAREYIVCCRIYTDQELEEEIAASIRFDNLVRKPFIKWWNTVQRRKMLKEVRPDVAQLTIAAEIAQAEAKSAVANRQSREQHQKEQLESARRIEDEALQLAANAQETAREKKREAADAESRAAEAQQRLRSVQIDLHVAQDAQRRLENELRHAELKAAVAEETQDLLRDANLRATEAEEAKEIVYEECADAVKREKTLQNELRNTQWVQADLTAAHKEQLQAVMPTPITCLLPDQCPSNDAMPSHFASRHLCSSPCRDIMIKMMVIL